MSNQIDITGGARVRGLNGVITGTSGVLSSVGLGLANGVATLDGTGKVPLSQLPTIASSYKGTWNATTNTPTIADGVGTAGDYYLVSVAGTQNLGSGSITFAVGNTVIYEGSIWQKSGGSTGVTSVGLSTNGGAITIGSSPITSAGTISFNFNGTSLQYVNGAGNLTTFPDLSGYVTLSGTQTITGAKTFSGGVTFSSSVTTTNLTFANSGFFLTLQPPTLSVNRTVTLPNATGTLALTSDLGSYLPLSGGTLTGALGGTIATFSSSVTALDIYAKQSTGGYVSLRNGGSGASGYVEFIKNDGTTRLGYLGYSTTNVEMTLENSAKFIVTGGNVLIGTTTDSGYKLRVNGTGYFDSSVTATSFFESSDSRLKTLIQDNYQTKGIASITPKLYIKNGKVELGYYAQDFVGILDSAVVKGEDEMLSLSYREVLVAKVYALEQRIKELETKFN